MGIVVLVHQPLGLINWGRIVSVPYLSVSLSFNTLVTLMHGRNIRAITRFPSGISGLYKVIATMLIGSSALYAVSSLLVIETAGR